MALLDHFHPPLSVRRHWHAFHNAWATYIASALNQSLPEGYFAEPNVQFGIEIDVAAFAEKETGRTREPAVSWIAPEPTRTVPFSIITDTVEVLVYSNEAGPTLAGAIELVSPANKDRLAHRNAFVSKCSAYLQSGIGLVMVDVVTDRRANLHNDLLIHLHTPIDIDPAPELYAVAYRPVSRDGEPTLDIWQEALALGEALPTLPLWLPGSLSVPVELDATYERTCREQRIVVE